MSEVMTERFAKIAAEFDGFNAIALGQAYAAARAKKDEIQALKNIVEAEINFLEYKLAEQMKDEGLPRFSLKVGEEEKRINYGEVVEVSAKQEGGIADRVIEILDNTGNGGLVKRTVAPATLKKFVTDLRKKGADGMPDPVLMQMIEAGMTVTAHDRAKFY
jgi:hypothetical protein